MSQRFRTVKENFSRRWRFERGKGDDKRESAHNRSRQITHDLFYIQLLYSYLYQVNTRHQIRRLLNK